MWLDDLSKPLIETGGARQTGDDGETVAITTNLRMCCRTLSRIDKLSQFRRQVFTSNRRFYAQRAR